MKEKTVKVALIFIVSLLVITVGLVSTHPSSVRASESSSRWPAVPTVGEQKIIVILAEFQDEEHLLPAEHFQELIFEQLNSYIKEVSYGQVWLTGDVVGWVNLPRSATSYKLYRPDVYNDCRRLARDVITYADADVDFSQYKYAFICVSGGLIQRDYPPTKAWGAILGRTHKGLNLLHARTTDGVEVKEGIFLFESIPFLLLTHLFGHCIGLPDLCVDWQHLGTGQGEHMCLFGRWDPMALPLVWGEGAGHYCAASKIKLGWIPDEKIHVAQTGETETLIIDPLELKSTGIQVVKIDVSKGKYYIIEVRREIGCEAHWLRGEGILITWIDETKSATSDTRKASMWRKELGFNRQEAPVNVFACAPPEIWRLIDAHPETPLSSIDLTGWKLDDAAFGVGTGYIDEVNNLALLVTREVGQSYEVVVTTAGEGQVLLEELKQKTEEIEQQRKAANSAITTAENAIKLAQDQIRIEGLDDAQMLLEEAFSNYEAGNYGKAAALALETRAAAEKTTKPQAYYDAQNLVEEAEQEIQQAETTGFHSQDALLLLTQASDEYGKACIAFTKNDFEDAKLHAEKALNLISEALDTEKTYVDAEKAHRSRQALLKIGAAALATILIAISLAYWYRRRHSVAR